MYQWNKKQAIDKTNKVKSGFFENICKIDKQKLFRKDKNHNQYQAWKGRHHYRSYRGYRVIKRKMNNPMPIGQSRWNGEFLGKHTLPKYSMILFSPS